MTLATAGALERYGEGTNGAKTLPAHVRERLDYELGVITKTGLPSPKQKFDVVVEATGSSQGLSTAVAMTNPRGTLVMKSTVHDRAAVDFSHIIVQEISLVGSRCGRFEPALKLLKTGKLNLDPMIDSRFSLAQAPQAFERANEKGVLKVLLDG